MASGRLDESDKEDDANTAREATLVGEEMEVDEVRPRI